MRDRLRSLLPVLITLLVVAYLVYEGPKETASHHEDDDADDATADDKLRIQRVDPVELSPGAAAVVQLTGAVDGVTVTAVVAKHDAPVLHHEGSQLVVQMPQDLPPGPAKIRVHQGERRSKPWILQIRPVPIRSVLRNVIGGLALFVLGLRTVGSALRTYAGQGVRARLEWLTRTPLRGVGVGAMVGGLTQSTTSSAGLLVGLLDARLLAVQTAAVMLVGAHLGAAATGALLPLAASREALWLIALGMMWAALAENRRARAVANIALGCGLLFYGLRLLQTGFEPLVADPEVLPYVRGLSASTVGGALTCMAAGAALCGLLQGPGPVFALVVSMAQSTGLIGLADGIAILSGTAVGAVVGTSAVGWPYGRAGRTLASTHFLMGAVMTTIALLGLPLWVMLAEAIVVGDAATADYTGRLLHPNVGPHLGVGFGLSQLAGAVGALLVRPALARVSERWAERGTSVPHGATGGLAPALHTCREALAAVVDVTRSRDRKPAVAAEQALTEVREHLEQMLSDPGLDARVANAATACMHLAGAIDGALAVAERGLERDLQASADDLETLDALHGLLLEGLDDAHDRALQHSALELETAQAREIRLNALEAEARRELATAGGDVRQRLWLGELLVAYETTGNHVYRVVVALTDQDG